VVRPTFPSRLLLAAVAVAGGLCLGPTGRAAASDDPFGPAKRPGGLPPAAPATAEPPQDVASFGAWLSSDDWLCRALAASELSRRSDDGTVALLARTLCAEEDVRATGLLLKSLAGRTREELVVEGGAALAHRCVELLAHRHAGVRARALEVLRPMPPVRLGDDPATYRAWWARGRAGLEVETRLLTERRARARAEARGSSHAPDETVTVAGPGVERWKDLDRIHRGGLEVMVCLDSTGSMGEVIEAAKRNVTSLVRRLRTLAPRCRVGLVTYDDGARLRIALTSDEAALERELSRVFAAGGEDYEEGVDKAVALAFKAETVGWSSKAMRVVLVVGDAPPHDEDVASMLRFVERRRDDPLFEAPIRVDTISTNAADGGDADGLVPYFKALAVAGRGASVRLRSASDLVAELLVVTFGPGWREPLRALLAELDDLDREGAARKKKG